MEKVVFFVDYANIDRAAKDKGFELDYADLKDYVAEGRFLVDAHCYLPIDPRNEHRMDQQIESLWRMGYIVNSKVGTIAGNTYRCDFDIEITMDVLKVMYQVRPDIIVLASGDSHFVPLVLELRKSGIRVEVASFEDAAAREMMLKGSGFISLDSYLEDCLAAEEECDTEGEDDTADDETRDDTPNEAEHEAEVKAVQESQIVVSKAEETAAQEPQADVKVQAQEPKQI